jgi:hypothetical protein
MSKRRRTVEIYAPTLGIKADAPTEMLDPRSVSTGLNFKCYFGVNQKEYGTTLFATNTAATFSAAPTMVYAATFPQVSVLEVATPTNIYQYTSGADTFVNDGQTFTGTYTDYWTALMFDNKFIYTNGKDPIQIKTAYNNTGTNLASAISPTTFNGWGLLALNPGVLNLYHTFENGIEYFKRVRWSAQAPLTYSAGTTDFSSGIAGAQDLDDGEGNLMGALPLAGGAVVYFENSIHYQSYIGGDAVWDFKKMIPGVGVPSRRAMYAYEEVNYVFSRQNIYRYYGGYYLDPIGDSIKQYLYGELNEAAINTVWVDFDKREGELLINIPTGTSTQPDTTWVYRILDKSWARKSRQHSAGGVFQRQSGLTIGQLVGNIGGQNYKFSDFSIKVSAQLKLYGDAGGRVVKHDYTVFSLSQTGTSVVQPYIYDTPDITANKAIDPVDGSTSEFVVSNNRWERCTIEMMGTGTAYVYSSTDRGTTYQQLSASPVNLVATGTNHIFDMDVSNPFVRIRIANTGLNDFVGVRYIKLDVLPGPQF